jgi:hypothetical protein
MAPEQRTLILHLNIDAVDDLNPLATTGIDAALDKPMAKELIGRQPQPTQDRNLEILNPMVEG